MGALSTRAMTREDPVVQSERAEDDPPTRPTLSAQAEMAASP
jgi:hypothetical protein